MNAFREGNNKMRVTDEMKEMIRLSNILKEESGLSFSEVMEMLCNLRAKMNKTLVVITHDPGIAEMAERRFTIIDGVLSEVMAK